jgi:hypothetical protein
VSERRSLLSEIRTYRAINRLPEFREPRPFWNAAYYGYKSWLDQFEFLWKKEPCGCARTGGGGALYCSREHFLARVAASSQEEQT